MLIELQDVGVMRGDQQVLHHITLRLQQHRVGVVGANGSGKSTLVRLFNGLVPASSGSVRVNGIDPMREPRAARREVGFVFQNPDHQIVLPHVQDDLAFGLRNQGVPRHEASQRVAAMLQQLGIEALGERLCHALSGGEKQLVALAAVLVMQPRLLVMDEPTTLLDLRHRRRLGRLLASLSQPAIVVSHDLDWLSDFDWVVVMENGRVVCEDVPAVALPYYRALQA